MMRFKLNQSNNISSKNIRKILSQIDSDKLYLEIFGSLLQQAESTKLNYSNQTAKKTAFNNYLCVNILKNWIKDNLDLKISPNTLPNIWEFVNGTSISINYKKVVLVPNEDLDIDGFEVQQEWVDIPNLAADYYLPMQVNLDAQYIYCWGFISRQTLKKEAEYNSIYRTYCIDRESIIEDLDLLWVACDLCGDEKGEIIPLSTLSELEAKALINTLSQPSPYSPRLEVAFEKWGALLNNDDWLQEFYVERLLKSKDRSLLIWLNERFEKVTTVPKKPTLAYRGNSSSIAKEHSFKFRGVELGTSEKIHQSIQQLLADSGQKIRGISSNLTDEDILRDLLLKGEKKISGEAAEIFWALASCTPPTPTRRVITIAMQLTNYPIILKVASVQTPSQKVVILLRVYSGEGQMHLLPELRLMPLDVNGHSITQLEVISQPFDEFIQRYFSFNVGYGFGCRVTLGNESITEHFIV